MKGQPEKNLPMAPQTLDDDRIIKSSETMFTIIEYIQQSDDPSVSEIADALGLSKGAVYKHLATLKKHGFVTDSKGTYQIGLRFLEIGRREQRERTLYRVSKPIIDDVAEKTGELVWCVIEENGLGVFLYGSQGEHAVKTDAIPGRRMHMHYLSGGKAMLAHMSEREVQQIIERYGLAEKTENTITSEQELREDLDLIRERGYAVDFEESVYGLHTVSAPILSKDRDPEAAVIIAGAATRMDPQTCEGEIADATLSAANKIELDLQYS